MSQRRRRRRRPFPSNSTPTDDAPRIERGVRPVHPNSMAARKLGVATWTFRGDR
jgi:hypothetical protein